MASSSQGASHGVQSRIRRQRHIQELDDEESILEGIIPLVSAEPAPEMTDEELCNTNPHFVLKTGVHCTLTFDPAMPSRAEKDVDDFLQASHIDPSENSALRGTSEADSEEEVEVLAPTADTTSRPLATEISGTPPLVLHCVEQLNDPMDDDTLKVEAPADGPSPRRLRTRPQPSAKAQPRGSLALDHSDSSTTSHNHSGIKPNLTHPAPITPTSSNSKDPIDLTHSPLVEPPTTSTPRHTTNTTTALAPHPVHPKRTAQHTSPHKSSHYKPNPSEHNYSVASTNDFSEAGVSQSTISNHQPATQTCFWKTCKTS